MSRVHSDSREGATIKTVANYFHAQISTTNDDERKELLSTIQQQREEAEKLTSVLPTMFVKDDGAGRHFPAMKESSGRATDEDLGAPKGRRREADSAVASASSAGQEVARSSEVVAMARSKAAPMPEFDVIRL